MKRIIVGLLAVFLMTAGLVTVASSTATATNATCLKYNNCVRTNTSVEGPRIIRLRTSPLFKVGVRAAGNVAPTGTVRLTVNRRGTSRVVYTATKRIVKVGPNLSRTKFRLPRFKRTGTYRLVFKYRPSAGSVFLPSKRGRFLKVRR